MYQYAFRQNSCDFKGATVLDVGTGTGLLAFFAAQAGARKVYAVEHAGPMATLAERLVKGNHMEKVIKVMNCSVEKCDLKEKVGPDC
jgi:protein arginine N-methyltransferase 1